MHDSRLPHLSEQIELEIKRLEGRRKETGWSPWALIAALAAICWQLSEQVARPHDWNAVGLYAALFVLIADLGRQIVRGLNRGVVARRPGVRFYPAHLHSGTRAFLLFLAVKMTAAAILVYSQAHLDGVFRVAWISMFSCYAFGAIIVVLGTWVDIPMPVGTPEKPKPLAVALVAAFWGLHLLLVTEVAFSLGSNFLEKYRAEDVQVALLILGLVEMAGLLLAFQAIEPLRQRLVHLQRRVALEEIGYEEGKAQLNEAIHGANIDVLMKDRLTELRDGFDRLEQNITQCAMLANAPATLSTLDERPGRGGKTRLLASAAADDLENCDSLLIQLWARTWDSTVKRAEGGRHLLAEFERYKARLSEHKTQLKDLMARLEQPARPPVLRATWRWQHQPSLRF